MPTTTPQLDRYNRLVDISDAAYYGTPAVERTDAIVRAFTAPDSVEQNAADLGFELDSEAFYGECADQLASVLDECGVSF